MIKADGTTNSDWKQYRASVLDTTEQLKEKKVALEEIQKVLTYYSLHVILMYSIF